MGVYSGTEYVNATDPTLRKTVLMAMQNAALNIFNENPTTTSHLTRAVYAHNVLTRPDQFVTQFQLAVCSTAGGSISTTSTDAQVDTAIASVWNAMAGAVPGSP